jgi:hypothetical protein
MKRAWLMMVGLLILILLLLFLRNGDEANGPSGAGSSEHVETPVFLPSGSGAVKGGLPTADVHAQALESAYAMLKENLSAAGDVLASLRAELFQGDQETSARAVSAFLRSSRDASTGMVFSVGPDGVLVTVPSLRTALLNWHPTLDPLVSLDMAREILRTTDSADEYAIALRNIAWNDLDGDLKPELSAAFHNLLGRRDWRQEPTAGYLESFDVAVALGDAPTFQHLADFVIPDINHPALMRVAAMSMDRMILRNPEHLSNGWKTNPQWMEQSPIQRASLLSRLDITRDDHRGVFLDYLSSDRLSPDERDYFEAIYPNGNHLHGHRLVTSNEKSPTIGERAWMDREILREIDQLLEQAPLSAAESLRKIRERLAAFVDP